MVPRRAWNAEKQGFRLEVLLEFCLASAPQIQMLLALQAVSIGPVHYRAIGYVALAQVTVKLNWFLFTPN